LTATITATKSLQNGSCTSRGGIAGIIGPTSTK
jgi:hypothetical protein